MEDLDKAIENMSRLLDAYDLPQDLDAAICLANDLDVLRKAKGIIKYYRDDLQR